MKRFLLLLVVLFLGSLFLCSPVQAVQFDLVGVTDPNNTAHVEFVYNPNLGIINIDVTNTAAGLDPRITGFAFNKPTAVTGVQSFLGPTGWDYKYDLNNIDTPGQYGLFDLAALTKKDFNGGDANIGIPFLQTYQFEFELAGTNLNTLNEASFLGSLSFDAAGPPTENPQYFIARFQRTGADGEGSDVAIPGTPIPEPSTMLLLGFGLMGLAAFGRKRFF